MTANGDIHRGLRLQQLTLDLRGACEASEDADFAMGGVVPHFQRGAVVVEHTAFRAFRQLRRCLTFALSKVEELRVEFAYGVGTVFSVHVQVKAVALLLFALRLVERRVTQLLQHSSIRFARTRGNEFGIAVVPLVQFAPQSLLRLCLWASKKFFCCHIIYFIKLKMQCQLLFE